MNEIWSAEFSLSISISSALFYKSQQTKEEEVEKKTNKPELYQSDTMTKYKFFLFLAAEKYTSAENKLCWL